MATQILVIFIIRTNGRPWRDLPGRALAVSSLLALVIAMALPLMPIGHWFGFEATPAPMLLGVGAIVLLYLALAELLKPLAIRAQDRPRAPGAASVPGALEVARPS